MRFKYRNNSKFTGGGKHKLYTIITFHNKDMKKITPFGCSYC